MARAWIVWNGSRSEGVVFADGPAVMGKTPYHDAFDASTGDLSGGVWSSLAEAFVDLYPDEDRKIQEIELP